MSSTSSPRRRPSGDDQIQIQPSPAYPPDDDHFASDSPGQYAVIKLIDKVMVTPGKQPEQSRLTRH